MRAHTRAAHRSPNTPNSLEIQTNDKQKKNSVFFLFHKFFLNVIVFVQNSCNRRHRSNQCYEARNIRESLSLRISTDGKIQWLELCASNTRTQTQCAHKRRGDATMKGKRLFDAGCWRAVSANANEWVDGRHVAMTTRTWFIRFSRPTVNVSGNDENDYSHSPISALPSTNASISGHSTRRLHSSYAFLSTPPSDTDCSSFDGPWRYSCWR